MLYPDPSNKGGVMMKKPAKIVLALAVVWVLFFSVIVFLAWLAGSFEIVHTFSSQDGEMKVIAAPALHANATPVTGGLEHTLLSIDAALFSSMATAMVGLWILTAKEFLQAGIRVNRLDQLVPRH
jgi:hypothetical protein